MPDVETLKALQVARPAWVQPLETAVLRGVTVGPQICTAEADVRQDLELVVFSRRRLHRKPPLPRWEALLFLRR